MIRILVQKLWSQTPNVWTYNETKKSIARVTTGEIQKTFHTDSTTNMKAMLKNCTHHQKWEHHSWHPRAEEGRTLELEAPVQIINMKIMSALQYNSKAFQQEQLPCLRLEKKDAHEKYKVTYPWWFSINTAVPMTLICTPPMTHKACSFVHKFSRHSEVPLATRNWQCRTQPFRERLVGKHKWLKARCHVEFYVRAPEAFEYHIERCSGDYTSKSSHDCRRKRTSCGTSKRSLLGSEIFTRTWSTVSKETNMRNCSQSWIAISSHERLLWKGSTYC